MFNSTTDTEQSQPAEKQLYNPGKFC